MAKYWGYCRISTLHQKDTSLEAQADFLRKRASELGLEFVKVEEKVSGTKFEERSEFIRVINSSEAGDIMGIYDDSRFGRETEGNLDYLKKLTDKGVKLESNGRIIDYNNPIDKMIFSMGSVFATYQRDIQRHKSLEGIAKKKENGDWILRGDTFGYNLTYNKGKPVVTINETEAKYIRKIYSEYLTGRSTLSICAEYKDAIKAECDYRLAPDNINRLLFRTIYMGYVTKDSLKKYDKSSKKTRDYTRISRMTPEELQKVLVKSNYYEPIVSEETWWGVFNSYRHLTRKGSTQYAYRFTPYELTGVIRTACPCHTGFIHSNSKRGYIGEVYKPTHHQDVCTDRNFKTLRKDLVEPIMRMTFWFTFDSSGHLKDFIEEEKMNDSLDELRRKEEETKQKINEVDKKKKNLVSYIMQFGGDDDIKKQMDSLDEEKASLNRYLEQVTNSISMSNSSSLMALMKFGEKAIKTFKNAQTAEERRDLYTKYCTALCSKDTLTVEYFNQQKFVIHWHFTRRGYAHPFAFEIYYKDVLERRGTIEPLSKTVQLELVEWETSYELFLKHLPEGFFENYTEAYNKMLGKQKFNAEEAKKHSFERRKFIVARQQKEVMSFLRTIEDRSPRELYTEE